MGWMIPGMMGLMVVGGACTHGSVTGQNPVGGRATWWGTSPFPVQFLQQPDGGPTQLAKAVFGWPRAMHRAFLRGLGSGLRTQSWGLELEVV